MVYNPYLIIKCLKSPGFWKTYKISLIKTIHRHAKQSDVKFITI